MNDSSDGNEIAESVEEEETAKSRLDHTSSDESLLWSLFREKSTTESRASYVKEQENDLPLLLEQEPSIASQEDDSKILEDVEKSVVKSVLEDHSPTIRARPESAAPASRVKEIEKNPNRWNVSEVSRWVVEIGFPQYRKKFLHNCIDGSLLFKLTDQQLKFDLGIGPLGHRHLILSSILHLKEELIESGINTQQKKTRPTSAPVSSHYKSSDWMDSGGMNTLHRHRVKLERDISRTQAALKQNRCLVQQLEERIRSDDERLRNLLRSLSQLDSSTRKDSCQEDRALDNNGMVPWLPTGEGTTTRNPYPERCGRLRDLAQVEETFHPRINASSTMLLGNSRMRGKTFFDRLNEDVCLRTKKQQQLDSASKRLPEHDTLADSLKKDADVVQQYLQQVTGSEISQIVHELETFMEKEFDIEDLQDQLELSETEMRRFKKATSRKKIGFLAGSIRTQSFLQNYNSELENRDSRLKQLQEKWLKDTLGVPDQNDQRDKELQELQTFLSCIGWQDDDYTDENIDALVTRGLNFKEAKEKGQEIDWTSFKDGLEAKCKQKADKSNETLALQSVVEMLGKVPSSDLNRIKAAKEERKQTLLYRSLRTQKFLNFVSTDIERREEKARSYWDSTLSPRKILSKKQVESFFDRLLEDGIKRRERSEQRINEKRMKEDKLIKELANRTYARKTRPMSAKSARRRSRNP